VRPLAKSLSSILGGTLSQPPQRTSQGSPTSRFKPYQCRETQPFLPFPIVEVQLVVWHFALSQPFATVQATTDRSSLLDITLPSLPCVLFLSILPDTPPNSSFRALLQFSRYSEHCVFYLVVTILVFRNIETRPHTDLASPVQR
jgi:hypothetical protein